MCKKTKVYIYISIYIYISLYENLFENGYIYIIQCGVQIKLLLLLIIARLFRYSDRERVFKCGRKLKTQTSRCLKIFQRSYTNWGKCKWTNGKKRGKTLLPVKKYWCWNSSQSFHVKWSLLCRFFAVKRACWLPFLLILFTRSKGLLKTRDRRSKFVFFIYILLYVY